MQVNMYQSIKRRKSVLNLLQKINRSSLAVAELGVHSGIVTSFLLQNEPRIERYVCVDTWKLGSETPEVYGTFLERIKPYINIVEVYFESTGIAYRKFSREFDLIFIDASHDFKNVFDDCYNWKGKVRRGGFLCGHDYREEFPGVIRAVDFLFPDRKIDQGFVWWIQCE